MRAAAPTTVEPYECPSAVRCAVELSWPARIKDYLWHLTLPLVCMVIGSFAVVTPATVPVRNTPGDLRVVCDRQGYRTSEVIYRGLGYGGYSGYGGPSVGLGLGGGGGNVGFGLGFGFPIGGAAGNMITTGSVRSKLRTTPK